MTHWHEKFSMIIFLLLWTWRKAFNYFQKHFLKILVSLIHFSILWIDVVCHTVNQIVYLNNYVLLVCDNHLNYDWLLAERMFFSMKKKEENWEVWFSSHGSTNCYLSKTTVSFDNFLKYSLLKYFGFLEVSCICF